MVSSAMERTLFETKSDVIREALRLFGQLRKFQAAGSRVVLRSDTLKRQYPLDLNIPHPTQPFQESVVSTISQTIEVRLPLPDSMELDRLKLETEGSTQAGIVRHALAVYADVADKLTSGWRLIACVGDQCLECSFVGLRADSPLGKEKRAVDAHISWIDESDWRNRLPVHLVQEFEDVAKKEGYPPELLATDAMRDFISKRSHRNALLSRPHSLEHLIAYHQEWSGNSLVVDLRHPLDADTFFPVLLKHLERQVDLFYLHSDAKSLKAIQEKLRRLPKAYSERIRKCIYWVKPPSDFPKERSEIVIFDPLVPERANGYIWHGHKSKVDCYDPLEGTQLEKAVRFYSGLIQRAKAERAKTDRRGSAAPRNQTRNKREVPFKPIVLPEIIKAA